MRIYFEDLKDEVQRDIVEEVMLRLAREKDDFPEDANHVTKPDPRLAEEAEAIISTRNYGVDMDF